MGSLSKVKAGMSEGIYELPFSFRNQIVDGRMDFWYEGTTQTTNGYGSATMYVNSHKGSTKVVTQGTLTPGIDLPCIDVPSAQFYLRTVVTSVDGASNFVKVKMPIEGVRTLAGKTVTLSFYAKADSVRNIGVEFYQSFGTGGSAGISTGMSTRQISTSWTRYSFTTTLPSIAGKTIDSSNDCLVPVIWFDAGSGTTMSRLGQQSGTFDLACIQLEEGSVATQFEELPIEISQERVNRYYQRINIKSDLSITFMASANAMSQLIALQGSLRSAPTTTITSVSTNVEYKAVNGASKVKPTAGKIYMTSSENESFRVEVTIPATGYAAGDYLSCDSVVCTFDSRL